MIFLRRAPTTADRVAEDALGTVCRTASVVFWRWLAGRQTEQLFPGWSSGLKVQSRCDRRRGRVVASRFRGRAALPSRHVHSPPSLRLACHIFGNESRPSRGTHLPTEPPSTTCTSLQRFRGRKKTLPRNQQLRRIQQRPDRKCEYQERILLLTLWDRDSLLTE